MKRTSRWWIPIGTVAVIVGIAYACGSGSSKAASIAGTLTKATSIQTAASHRRDGWFAVVSPWVGAKPAIAVSTTACGNPSEPASGTTVTLLLNGHVVQSTTTTSGGDFSFLNIPGGNYVIQVTLASGAISVPAVVQAGLVTNITGEIDPDCHDVDHDGNTTEPAIHMEAVSEDGSRIDADETEHGGSFDGHVKKSDGSVEHQHGHKGDRSDEVDDSENGTPAPTETPEGTTTPNPTATSNLSPTATSNLSPTATPNPSPTVTPTP